MPAFKRKNLLLKLEITELHKQIYSLFNSNKDTEKIISESSKLFKEAISAYDDLIEENNKKIELNKKIIECNNIDIKGVLNNKSSIKSLNKITENKSSIKIKENKTNDLLNNNKLLEGEIKHLQNLYNQYKRQRSALYVEEIALFENLLEDNNSENIIKPSNDLKNSILKEKKDNSTLKKKEISPIEKILNETKQKYKNTLLEEQKNKFDEAKAILRKKMDIKKSGGAFISQYSFDIQNEIIDNLEASKKRNQKRLQEDLNFFIKEYEKYKDKLFNNDISKTTGDVVSYSIGNFNNYRNKIKRQINKIIKELENNQDLDGENIRELYKNRKYLTSNEFKKIKIRLTNNLEITTEKLHDSYKKYNKEVLKSIDELKNFLNNIYNDERDSTLKRHIEVINRHLLELKNHQNKAIEKTIQWYESEFNQLNGVIEIIKKNKEEGLEIFEEEKKICQEKIKEIKQKLIKPSS